MLIEPVINGITHGTAVQTKKFSFCLKITNTGKKPSSPFTISSLHMTSAEGKNIMDDFDGKNFFVETINPHESKIIPVGSSGQIMYGLVDIKISAQSTNGIIFSQKNAFTGEVSELNKMPNQWTCFLYIKSSTEYRQEVTTNWMIALTVATSILAIMQVLK